MRGIINQIVYFILLNNNIVKQIVQNKQYFEQCEYY